MRIARAGLAWRLRAMAWLPQAEALACRERLRPRLAQFGYAACVPFGREPDAEGRVGLWLDAAATQVPDAAWLEALRAVLSAGLALGLFLSPLLAGWLAVYLALSLSYSLWIKKTLIVDTFALTALTMHRVLTGFIIAGTAPAFWLLLFTGFFAFGLAMLARYGELRGSRLSGTRRATRAVAYRPGDLDILAGFGLAGSYMAVLILALYALTPEAHAAFRSPQALWILCPLLLYWIGRVWVYARRGRVPEDPILFALRDPVSGYVAMASVGIFGLAAFVVLPLYPII